MYRISIAKSGYYYVQKYNPCKGWRMVGVNFFKRRLDADYYLRKLENCCCCCCCH